jgi:hypothetical protein
LNSGIIPIEQKTTGDKIRLSFDYLYKNNIPGDDTFYNLPPSLIISMFKADGSKEDKFIATSPSLLTHVSTTTVTSETVTTIEPKKPFMGKLKDYILVALVCLVVDGLGLRFQNVVPFLNGSQIGTTFYISE